MISPRTFLEIAVAVIVGVAGLFWLRSHEDTATRDWKRQLAEAQAKVATDTKTQQAATVHYDTVEKAWIKYRDRILHDTVNPPTVREREIIAHADTVRLAADTVIKTDTVVIHGLRTEAKIAENPPSLPRVGLFGEALYDLVGREPVARLGADVRVYGPLDLSVAVQAQRSVKPQALVGLRWRF